MWRLALETQPPAVVSPTAGSPQGRETLTRAFSLGVRVLRVVGAVGATTEKAKAATTTMGKKRLLHVRMMVCLANELDRPLPVLVGAEERLRISREAGLEDEIDAERGVLVMFPHVSLDVLTIQDKELCLVFTVEEDASSPPAVTNKFKTVLTATATGTIPAAASTLTMSTTTTTNAASAMGWEGGKKKGNGTRSREANAKSGEYPVFLRAVNRSSQNEMFASGSGFSDKPGILLIFRSYDVYGVHFDEIMYPKGASLPSQNEQTPNLSGVKDASGRLIDSSDIVLIEDAQEIMAQVERDSVVLNGILPQLEEGYLHPTKDNKGSIVLVALNNIRVHTNGRVISNGLTAFVGGPTKLPNQSRIQATAVRAHSLATIAAHSAIQAATVAADSAAAHSTSWKSSASSIPESDLPSTSIRKPPIGIDFVAMALADAVRDSQEGEENETQTNHATNHKTKKRPRSTT